MTAAALVAGLAAPAHASQTPQFGCGVSGGGPVGYDYDLTAIAYYEPAAGLPGLRKWTKFRYRVDGIIIGDSNNISIRLSEGGTVRFAYDSPDNRHAGVWYEVIPSVPIFTFIEGSGDPHDHRSDDVVTVHAIFDRPRRSDPNCTATSARL